LDYSGALVSDSGRQLIDMVRWAAESLNIALLHRLQLVNVNQPAPGCPFRSEA
jgi:hypothetical protein